MKTLHAFVAGMLVPAFVAPFFMLFLVLQGWGDAIISLPTIYLGPILWGLWNVLFVKVRKLLPIPDRTFAIALFGAAYGLLSALVNGLYFEFTSVISTWPDSLIIVIVVFYPTLLYFTWKYVVNALNVLFEAY